MGVWGVWHLEIIRERQNVSLAILRMGDRSGIRFDAREWLTGVGVGSMAASNSEERNDHERIP